MVEHTDRGPKTSVLYSGPTAEAKIVLPVGEFHLFVEVHEEAEAFAIYDIDLKFPVYLPTEEEYNGHDFDAVIGNFADTGDDARVQQMLQADVRWN